MKRSSKYVLAVTLGMLLTACGGGSVTVEPPAVSPADAVPAEASASVAGLLAYLTALFAAVVDDKEPVDLGSFLPKTADDAEPSPLT